MTNSAAGREATPGKAISVPPPQRISSSCLDLSRCGQPNIFRTTPQAVAKRLFFVMAGLFLVSVAILTRLAEAVSVGLLRKDTDTWSLP